MNILVGWWIWPAVLTVMFFYIGSRYTPTRSAYAFDIEGLFRYGGATIASLVVWLVYAFAT